MNPHDLSDKTTRRQFVNGLTMALTGAALTGVSWAQKPKHILLRSSWQAVNIGDIAHTPGVLSLLEKYLPEVKVTLWYSNIGNGVEQLLRSRFPQLEFVRSKEEVEQAFKDCDFLLHGSGPSLVAERHVAQWKEQTNKPYGVYGITLSAPGGASQEDKFHRTIEILSGAQFVFFRDSHSLALAKKSGCTANIMEFGPDGAFACDLREDEKAESFLAANGLEPGGYVCCIPRLRITPYWTLPSNSARFDEAKHRRNEIYKHHDHAPHRRAIERIVRETNLKVLLCPEDQTQMAVGKENIFDQLSPEAKKRVVWRPDYWLTGEALSTYVRSVGLFGNEMHSPIMCVGAGIPAIVCRWAEQTSKGYMWQDIGLADWLFDFDREEELAKAEDAILAMVKDPAAAQAKVLRARERVVQRQHDTMAILGKTLISNLS